MPTPRASQKAMNEAKRSERSEEPKKTEITRLVEALAALLEADMDNSEAVQLFISESRRLKKIELPEQDLEMVRSIYTIIEENTEDLRKSTKELLTSRI